MATRSSASRRADRNAQDRHARPATEPEQPQDTPEVTEVPAGAPQEQDAPPQAPATEAETEVTAPAEPAEPAAGQEQEPVTPEDAPDAGSDEPGTQQHADADAQQAEDAPDAPATGDAPEQQPQAGAEPEDQYTVFRRDAAELAAEMARTEDPGMTVSRIYRVDGSSGRSVAASAMLAQVAFVLGAGLHGRAITHDNTKGRPAQMHVLMYGRFADRIMDLLAQAEAMAMLPESNARKGSSAARHQAGNPKGTYEDNRAARAALLREGYRMAGDIALSVAAIGLSKEEIAQLTAHRMHIQALEAMPIPQEQRRFAIQFADADKREGRDIPAYLLPPAPVQVTAQAPAQQATATAAA